MPRKKIALQPTGSVAEELRRWRKEKGWTRRQAADFLKVNVRTLESWEYGYRVPPMTSVLEKLWLKKKG